MIYEFGRWRVPLANRQEHLRVMQAIYANIKGKRPKLDCLLSSRFFTKATEADSGEIWMYIDEYTDMAAQERCAKALLEDAVAAELRGRWEKLIAPNSFQVELWGDLHRELWMD